MTEEEEMKLRSFVYYKLFQSHRNGNDFSHRWGDVIDCAIKSHSSEEFKMKCDLNGLEASEDYIESLGRMVDGWERTDENNLR